MDWKPVLDPLTGRIAAEFDFERDYFFMRKEWIKPRRFKLTDTHPAFNIAGLMFSDATLAR